MKELYIEYFLDARSTGWRQRYGTKGFHIVRTDALNKAYGTETVFSSIPACGSECRMLIII